MDEIKKRPSFPDLTWLSITLAVVASIMIFTPLSGWAVLVLLITAIAALYNFSLGVHKTFAIGIIIFAFAMFMLDGMLSWSSLPR